MWRNGTSFGLNDLEAFVTVAREAKEWISASRIEALSCFQGKPPTIRGFPRAPCCFVTIRVQPRDHDRQVCADAGLCRGTLPLCLQIEYARV